MFPKKLSCLFQRTRWKEFAKYSTLNHVYQNLIPWKTQTEFVDHLQQSIIYEDESILVINKPYGIPMKPLSYEKSQTATSPLKGPDLAIFSISSKLAEQKNIEEFFETYSQSRLHSGIVVLAKSHDVKQNLRNYFRKTRSQNIFNDAYRVITNGIPEAMENKVDEFPIERVTIDGNLQTIKSHLLSKTKRENNLQAVPRVTSRIISTNLIKEVALVEVQSSITKWDILQTYMLHRKSTILGDQIYSSRLKSISGVKVIDKPKPSQNIYQLPGSVINSLGIADIAISLVPLHIHCYSLNIPRITKRNKRREILELIAPLPPHFDYSLKHLELQET